MKLVKIPLINSILLRSLKQKFCQINKRGGPNKVRGWEKFPKINKRGGTFIKHQRVLKVVNYININKINIRILENCHHYVLHVEDQANSRDEKFIVHTACQKISHFLKDFHCIM